VFFDLNGLGRLVGREVILIDSNPDLIGCYETVRQQPERVARALDELADGHAAHGSAHYYAVRDTRFNPSREQLRRPDGGIAYTTELAAMLLYLNRTGFNGLFRVNAQGAFNVPAGRYAKPAIRRREQLIRTAEALSGVQLICGSFDRVTDIAGRGDFLYCDPPYAPLTRTSNFTSYTTSSFEEADQTHLQQLSILLARRGSQLLLSNSTADQIAALYERNVDARAAGLRTLKVPARRAINCNASRRGYVEEYVITNIVEQF
jgi:DNA adenine methylase